MPALVPATAHAAATVAARGAAPSVAPDDAPALDFALLLSQGLGEALPELPGPGAAAPEPGEAVAAADLGAAGTLDLATLPPIPLAVATVQQRPAEPVAAGGAAVAGLGANAAGKPGARVQPGPAAAADAARPGTPAPPQPFVLPDAPAEAAAEPAADVRARPADVAAPEALTAAHGLHAPSSARAEAAVLRVDAPVASPDWPEEMSQRVVWLVNRGEQTAALHLNPPQLGPVEITVTVSGDQASASFVAHQVEVREALEAALPRLREMLAEAGFNLGQASVSAGSAGREGASGEGRSGRRGGQGQESAERREAESGSALIRSGRGLVDTFV